MIFLYEEHEPKKQDYKDYFQACLFSLRAGITNFRDFVFSGIFIQMLSALE